MTINRIHKTYTEFTKEGEDIRSVKVKGTMLYAYTNIKGRQEAQRNKKCNDPES